MGTSTGNRTQLFFHRDLPHTYIFLTYIKKEKFSCPPFWGTPTFLTTPTFQKLSHAHQNFTIYTPFYAHSEYQIGF